MTFGTTQYLAWAQQHYGSVDFDLASSGVPTATLEDVGLTVPPLDDPSAYVRLRASIASYNNVSAAEVIPALGASHGIFVAYAAMLSPGDELLVETPGYEPLVRAAEGLGAVVRRFERSAATGFAIDLERVAAAMSPKTRAVVVTNLHNPTGVRIAEEDLMALATLARERGAYLVVNELYAPFDELAEDGVFRGSARHLGPNVLAIGSLTKCYGLGTHRVGWVLAPPELQDEARAAHVATVGHLPLSHACVADLLLSNIGLFAKRARATFEGKREIVEAWIASFPEASWSAPKSGLFGLVTLEGRGDLLQDIERLIRERDVVVGPGTFFGAKNGFRLSWATLSRARLTEALSRLEPLIRPA